MIRTFVAVHPDAQVLSRIAELQETLRATGADVRWVKPESMHLTLQFLGDVPEREIGGITRALENAFRDQAPVEMECRGVGVFPSLRRPRVVWVGLEGQGLVVLAERSEVALAPLGFPPAEREFRPHLTLGRLRSPRAFEAIAAQVRAAASHDFGSSRISEAVLYQSELRPTGSVYTPLETFRFTAVND